MKRSALFSEDRQNRYELVREWDDELFTADGKVYLQSTRPTVNFIMLNPSTADEQTDDPTIRKCIGFAKRWGYSRLVVTNLIPLVCTNPWKLPPWTGIDMKNRAIQQHWMGVSNLVVAAWGSQPAAVRRTIALSEHVYLLRQTAPVALHCIGLTKNGAPLHPSRTAYTKSPMIYLDAVS